MVALNDFKVLFKPKQFYDQCLKKPVCWELLSVTWAEEVQFSSSYRADEDTGFGGI